MYELNNMMGYGSRNVLKVSYENAWTADRPENNSIGFVYNDPGLSYMTSEAVEDGSFLRLSTLSLAYNFPRKMISKLGVSSLRVALTGTNLWLLTRYSGFDPEANTGWGTVAKLSPGYDQSPYPRPRSYMVSLNLGF
jgi:TonB-dependent starch-binding outer membrane protein SusC